MNNEMENNNKQTTKVNVVEIDQDGIVTNYKYQVVFVDEYNNWYLLGFFNDLRDAEDDLNSYLEGYEIQDEETGECVEPQFGDTAPLGHLTEYPSTLSVCFDKILDTTCGCVEIRGFVFN